MQKKGKAIVRWAVRALNLLVLISVVTALCFLFFTRSVFNVWHHKNMESPEFGANAEVEKYISLYGNSFSDLVGLALVFFSILIGISASAMLLDFVGLIIHKRK